ncbi:MAG: adenylosuccinate synthetase, partial [Acidobacteriaceae bacterium]|nr:adenylosuccinate synthetase [Acidobacteriaceae bacterium]
RGLEAIKPVYTNLKGWPEPTEGIVEWEKLPHAAREYLEFLEWESGAKIGMVSTGPDREQTMAMPEFAEMLRDLEG